MRPKRLSSRPAANPRFREEDRLWMVIDPESREALRFGTGPRESGPVFFTSEAALRAYCAEAGISRYDIHEVPASVLPHMRGKPFWLDARPCTVEQAAHILRGADGGGEEER